MIKDDLECLIGNTPITKLKSIKNSNIYIKLEFLNLGGSIKSRVAYSMLKEAQKNYSLKNKTILEASGGNTAIGLATFSNFFEYDLKLVIPNNYSRKKIEQLKLYGADVILSNHKLGNNSHIQKARELEQQQKDLLYIDQTSNNANVKTHYFNTAGEIIKEFSNVDYFLTGIGSGGTITGVGKRLKEEFNTKIIAVMPTGYDIVNQKFIPHKIQGIGIGLVPNILDLNIIDDYIYVDYEEILEILPQVMHEDGLFVGISALANIVASKKLSKKISKDKIVVTIAQDSGDSYIEYYTKDYHEHKNNK
jgi:cysteine synthase A